MCIYIWHTKRDKIKINEVDILTHGIVHGRYDFIQKLVAGGVLARECVARTAEELLKILK